jgi:Flp pilus assembly protein TadB
MFYIPIWISNLLLLVTCYLSGFQLVQMNRPNRIMNIQFLMIVFCLTMMVFITLSGRHGSPWMSLLFFIVAVSSLSVMIRQHRMLPPMKQFE